MVQSKIGSVALAAALVVAGTVSGHAKDMAAAPAPPRAKPIGNPASWFPADAYPPAARNAGAEGRTVFSLDIDALGRIMRCNIVTSSGSELLDNTTCDLLVINGRFEPAHDASGRPVAGTWQSGMRWKLVQDSPSFEDDETP